MQKESRIDQELRAVESIRDEHGRPVDEKIRYVVAALRCHGFITTMSCQGHLELGFGPWISIESPEAPRLLKMMQDGPHSGDGFMDNRKVLYRANAVENNRLYELLKAFYALRVPSYPILLTIRERGPGYGRLTCHNSELMKLEAHQEEFDQWLSDAQAEMQAFAEFLVSKLE
jgi:hypothetical protein